MTRATSATTRHERRLAEREDRRDDRRGQRRDGRRRYQQRSVWRSPMVLLTGGALVIGLAIVGYSVLQQPAPPSTQDLSRPAVSIPANLAEGRTLGVADAPVTVEIWSDFQCPACQLFAEETEPAVVGSFVVPGTARLVYRDAAFQGARGPNPAYDESVEAGAAARCAADQGLFWQMHNWIFANWNGENKGAFAAPRLAAIAEAAGLDVAAYSACLATGDKQTAVRAETGQAVAAGISSTPTIVINGAPYAGVLTIAQISQLITQAAQPAP